MVTKDLPAVNRVTRIAWAVRLAKERFGVSIDSRAGCRYVRKCSEVLELLT
jgi:hypothetical protein